MNRAEVIISKAKDEQNLQVTRVTAIADASNWTRRYEVLPDTPELRCVIDAIASGKLSELVSCARDRRGYGNSDGGFGVNYPGESDGIPEGNVEVYGFFGLPDGYEYQVSEATYLEALSKVLEVNGMAEDARAIDERRGMINGSGGNSGS